MPVKNVVFDVGSVLVTWDPKGIIATFFHERDDLDQLTEIIFKSEAWKDLNKCFITEKQLVDIYHQQIPSIAHDRLEQLMTYIKESLTPVTGSFELLNTLYLSNIPPWFPRK